MRWARIAAICLIGSLVACGGDDGADAAALCERPTINGLEDQLTDDGVDFAELRDSLEVVRAAADGDLDRQTDALIDASDQFLDALESVDLDDDDAVDDAVDEVAEDLDEDIVEDIEEVLAFVDDECETDLIEAAADDTDDPSGNDEDDDEDEDDEDDPVEAALDSLCADDTVDTIRALFDGGALDGDFDDERDALALVSEASDHDLDEQVDLLLDAVDVMENLDGTGISDDEAADALGEAFVEEFGVEGLAEVTAAGEDVTSFIDGECGTDLSDPETPTSDDIGTSDDSLEDFADLVASCEDGDMADCDELFFDTPVGSEAEDIGRTCGGLGDQTTAGRCEELFG